MGKVLVIGADSFTGIYLEGKLKHKGWDVYGTSYSDEGEKLYKCDIRDSARVGEIFEEVKPDCIIHLAGITFPAHGCIEDFYEVNTVASINILDEILKLKHRPQKIILVSSSVVYGNQGVRVLDESLCPRPTGHYGASKLAMENLAINYFDKLPIVVARPFNYTGLGQHDCFLIPKIVKHYKEKAGTIELGNIDVSREFNSVDFVCEAYVRLLSALGDSQVVNIASNKGIKLLDVIAMMNDISGYDIKVKINNKFVRQGEIKSLTGSNSLLFEMVGNVPNKPLKEILREMYEGTSS